MVLNMSNAGLTQKVSSHERTNQGEVKEMLHRVYDALADKGYNPLIQIGGYILSSDPTYITAHNNARNLITKIERDELLEEILRDYLRDVL